MPSALQLSSAGSDPSPILPGKGVATLLRQDPAQHVSHIRALCNTALRHMELPMHLHEQFSKVLQGSAAFACALALKCACTAE